MGRNGVLLLLLPLLLLLLFLFLLLLLTITPMQTKPNPKQPSLVAFGRFAGLAGMVDALQALGQNLLARGFNTPFLHSPAAYMYVHMMCDACDVYSSIILDPRPSIPTGPLIHI